MNFMPNKVFKLSEPVNSYLKDSFGCKHITVKGATKIAGHLMFGF
ncbi:hypothetical protein [Sulfuricurvum sp.]|nr:hypothetical protein [Sulfuricurvum sp.]